VRFLVAQEWVEEADETDVVLVFAEGADALVDGVESEWGGPPGAADDVLVAVAVAVALELLFVGLLAKLSFSKCELILLQILAKGEYFAGKIRRGQRSCFMEGKRGEKGKRERGQMH